MKTLKTLLLTATLIISSLTATAQEKQNDATWEETIEFLNKHSDMLMWYDNVGGIEKWKKFDKIHFVSEDNTTFLRLEYSRVDSKWSMSGSYSANFDLKFIKNVIWTESSQWGKNHMRINFTREQPFFTKRGSSPRDFHSFKLSDSEINRRYYKALQQLAYLAKEKREAERKASGDKF